MLLFDELSDRPAAAGETARRAAARAGLVPNPKARLKAQFHEVCRFKHLAVRSEEAYLQWIKRFIVFHKGKAEILKAENRNRKAEGNSEHPTANIQQRTSNSEHPTANIQHPTANEAGMTGGAHCPTHHHLTGGTSYFSDPQSGRIIPVVSIASARREDRAHTPEAVSKHGIRRDELHESLTTVRPF